MLTVSMLPLPLSAILFSCSPRTILVSHSLEQVRKMCNKVLWLDHGQQMAFGETAGITADYEAFLSRKPR